MGFETKDIRNVTLLGHSGTGKTTFAECMLYEAKVINRRGSIEDKNTASDYTMIEQNRGSSVFATLLHANWKDCKINIIDTPGLDDFAGEVISALKVADTALVMLNSRHGVEVGSELAWEYVQKFHTPAMLVINHLDHEKADFDTTLEQAKQRFGPKVLPIQYPYNPGNGFNAIIDALKMVMYVFPAGGGKPEKKEIPSSETTKAFDMHNALVEIAAENEDGLMEKFFEQGTLSEEELASGLTIALAHQTFFPVFCASASQDIGSGRIMGFIHDICPSPADRPAAPLVGGGTLPCLKTGPTTVFIFKTISEPKVGNLSYFKVYSGVLKSGDDLHNMDNDGSERFSQLQLSNGKNRDLIDHLVAGDLGLTVKLRNSHTNNTLNAKGNSSRILPIEFPEPRVRVAVSQSNKSDVEKIAKALHIIHEEDPTLQIEHSQELKQLILHGQGELHMDLVKYRIEKVYDVHIEFEKPKIPYRETITKVGDAQYRHKKQSGGAGQFAEVHMRIEPWHEGMPDPAGLHVRSTEIEKLKWGGQLVFHNCVVGGTIDSRFMNAIRKGIMQKMEEGPITGSYCRDIRVCVYDGKMHAVDSNDMAFQIAGSYAFRQAFHDAGPQVLEPVYNLEVKCPAEMTGEVIGDLQTRRAIVMGMDSDGHYQIVNARIPLSETHSYSGTLRSLTQGRAKFHLAFADYEQVPTDIQKKLADAHAAHEVVEA
jgi:elongation factor G